MRDEDDFAILAAIHDEPLGGPASWARAANVGDTHCRRRVKHLEASGVLRGFSGIPSHSAFGRTHYTYGFRGDIPGALELPDVAWIGSVLHGPNFLHAYAKDDPGLADRFDGAMERFESVTPPEEMHLGRMDLKVLRAMIEDPRKSIAALCKETGLSNKTVMARRDHLIASGAIRVEPILRPPLQAGRLFFHMGVVLEEPMKIQAPNVMTLNHTVSPARAYLFCTASSLPEQMALVAEIGDMDGVLEAKMLMGDGFEMATRRLQGWCDVEIEKWGKGAERA